MHIYVYRDRLGLADWSTLFLSNSSNHMHARARKWGTRSTAASNRLSYRVIIVDPRTRDTRYYVLYVYTDYYSYVSNNYKGTTRKYEI